MRIFFNRKINCESSFEEMWAKFEKSFRNYKNRESKNLEKDLREINKKIIKLFIIH